MHRRASPALILAASLVVIAACPDATPDPGVPQSLPDDPGVEPGDPGVLALTATEPVGFDRFVTSAGCALCHSNHVNATAMRDETNREIAPFNLWRGTMMANAARDPLWRAAVSAEVKQTRRQKAAIEAKCMRCHAPMASEAARSFLLEPTMADLSDDARSLTQLAMDGVSCSVCHQIQADNLGTEESWSGGFTIGRERLIYGPHRNPAPGPMQNHVNYTPTYATHVVEAKMCATCHTLFTHAFDEEGDAIEGASFLEQATYLEWQNSSFNNEEGQPEGKACQACHMPTTSEDGEVLRTRIARAPPGFDFNINERAPFGRHAFVGANTLMPSILKNERAILSPQATDLAFDATVELARRRLQELTAAVTIDGVTTDGGALSFDVTVRSDVGHKLPTGFPSRRAWLRVEVVGENGEVLFVSGDFDSSGRILDGTGAVLDVEKAAGPFEPHHDVITGSHEVQIYEQTMGGVDGKRTASLLRATQHLKDNRILPRGYRDDHAAHAYTKPVGVEGDDDFVASQDTVRYVVDTGGKAPARVEVTLLYQSVGARYATDLFQVDTPEVRGFRTMYERADLTPVEVATAAKNL